MGVTIAQTVDAATGLYTVGTSMSASPAASMSAPLVGLSLDALESKELEDALADILSAPAGTAPSETMDVASLVTKQV